MIARPPCDAKQRNATLRYATLRLDTFLFPLVRPVDIYGHVTRLVKKAFAGPLINSLNWDADRF